MTIDLTGGFDEAREFVFAKQPDDPEMRESVNVWVWDSSPGFGLPRVGIEAVADQWDTHDIQMNLAFADGRVFEHLRTRRRARCRRPRRAAARARRRPAVVRARRAVPPLAGPARRSGGRDVHPGADRRLAPRSGPRRACARAVRPRHPVRGTAVGMRHPARRGGSRARHPGGGRAHGRPPLRAALPRRPAPCRSATSATSSTAEGFASGVRVSAGSPRSEVTAGSRRSSPVGGRSASTSTRRAPTASRRSTRGTCSRVTAS